jgi:putative transposase
MPSYKGHRYPVEIINHTRQRERAMKRFTSPGHAQRFLSAFSGISSHFRPGRHRLTAPEWRAEMADRFRVWREVTATVVA